MPGIGIIGLGKLALLGGVSAGTIYGIKAIKEKIDEDDEDEYIKGYDFSDDMNYTCNPTLENIANINRHLGPNNNQVTHIQPSSDNESYSQYLEYLDKNGIYGIDDEYSTTQGYMDLRNENPVFDNAPPVKRRFNSRQPKGYTCNTVFGSYNHDMKYVPSETDEDESLINDITGMYKWQTSYTSDGAPDNTGDIIGYTGSLTHWPGPGIYLD